MPITAAQLFYRDYDSIAVEDLTSPIDRTPVVDQLAIEHVRLIEMPVLVSKAPHAVHPLPPAVASKHRTEPVPPLPHGLVTDVDGPLEQQVFDIPK